MYRLAITSQKQDISQHVALAREYDIGIEIQVYGYNPNLLDGDWQSLVRQHQALLRDFAGDIALHGAFYDMSGSSADRRIIALTRERYLTNLHVGAELGARNIVFHANFLPLIHRPSYLPDWTRRQVAFWGELIPEAERLGLVICLENMWEPAPEIIGQVVEQVGSPHLRACLDVGHVHLSSNSLSFAQWLERLGRHVVHCHINNPRGKYDEHLSLDTDGGMVDYEIVLPMLQALTPPPLISLEMDRLEDLERSLRYLGR